MSSGSRASRPRLCVVDGQEVVRRGLSELLSRQPERYVVREASDVCEARCALQAEALDVVMLDIACRGALDLVRELTGQQSPRVLAFSHRDEAIYAETVLQAGARGYLMKTADLEEILTAVRQVLDGERYLSASLLGRMVGDPSLRPWRVSMTPLQRLTSREYQVYRLIGRGVGTRDIARSLGISVKTVETYRTHLLEKLNLYDGMELARHAACWSALKRRTRAPVAPDWPGGEP